MHTPGLAMRAAIVLSLALLAVPGLTEAHENPATRLSGALGALQEADSGMLPGPGSGKVTYGTPRLSRGEIYRRRVAFDTQVRVVDVLLAATEAAAHRAGRESHGGRSSPQIH